MAKAEWGSKHECPNCSTRFYDMLKPSPLTCPKCDFVFATDVLHRLRKGKSLKSLMDDAAEDEADNDNDELETADEAQTDAEMIMSDDEEDDAPGNKDDYSIDDDLILPDDEDGVGNIEELPEDLLGDDLDEDASEDEQKEK